MPPGEQLLKQGQHPDPRAPGYVRPEPSSMSTIWWQALASREMAIYRATLGLPGRRDVRAAIIDDLSTYHELDEDECVRRCLNWEAWSVEEWGSADRSTPAGLRDFYNSTTSWSFDLAWYAYLQAEGSTFPSTVIACRALRPPALAPRCLDFGSGIGDTAQLLISLGYSVDLADISSPLLSFARWRLERRGQRADYIDLNETTLPADTYDAIIAKDVLTHVPDFSATVTQLHRALRPGGLLIATIDARPMSAENAWHLYDDELHLRRTLQDIGFEQVRTLDWPLFTYRRVRPFGTAHLIRRARNAVFLGPPRRAYRRMRSAAYDLRARWRGVAGA